MAVLRSPASSSERQLWRKLPFNHDESTAIADPTETLVTDMNYDLYFALFWQSRLPRTFMKMIHVFLMFKRPAFGYKTQPAFW